MEKTNSSIFGIPYGSHPLRVVVPQFVTKSMRHSNLLSSEPNLVTVEMRSSVDLSALDQTVISISNILGANIPATVSLLAVNSGNKGHLLFCSSNQTDVPAFADWSPYTLHLSVCDGATVRAQATYKFSFAVTNPNENQESPAIQIASEGIEVKIPVSDVEKFGESLLGVEGGSDPLRVVVPEFLTKTVSQSSPVANSENVLSVAVKTSIELSSSDLSIVTISGLRGAIANRSVELGLDESSWVWDESINASSYPFCDSNKEPGRATWDQALESLTLFVCGGSVRVGETYLFTVNFRNPDQTQLSPPVNISASGSLVSIPESSVVKPGIGVLGVPDGLDPLRVVVPAFQVAQIAQRTPLAKEINTITVSLQTSLDLSSADSSYIRIDGLAGAIVSDPIFPFNAVTDGSQGESKLCNANGQQRSANWNQAEFRMLMYVCAGQVLEAGTTYAFSFDITNPHWEQDAPTVSIVAFGNEVDFDIAPMTSPASNLLGVTEGRKPLRVVVPRFKTLDISQETPLASTPNALSISLKTSVDLSDTTVVTISGLEGAIIANASVSVKAFGAEALFCDQGQNSGAVSWDEAQATLFLHVCDGNLWRAEQLYNLEIGILNPAEDQMSPSVRIQSQGAIVVIPVRAMKKQNEKVLGVVNGSDPLRVQTPRFVSKSIYQETPLSGLRNTITVVLETTVNLEGVHGSVITISGLERFTEEMVARISPVQGGHGAEKTFCTFGNQSQTALWTNVTENLLLTLCPTSNITAGVYYTFQFVFTNPVENRVSPEVFITAQGTANFDLVAMDKPGEDILGVGQGRAPLTTVIPTFTQKRIWQTNPLSGLPNTIFVLIETTVNLQHDDGVYLFIRNFMGAIPSNSSVGVTVQKEGTDVDEIFCDGRGNQDASRWNAALFGLSLYVCPGMIVESNTEYLVSFNFRNSENPQESPTIDINATGTKVKIPREVIQKVDNDVLGLALGAHPLRIEVPAFLTRSIAQSTPLAEVLNTITVTLRSNFNLAGADIASVTMSGLVGAIVGDLNHYVTLHPTEANTGGEGLFCNPDNGYSREGVWNESSATLTLSLCSERTLRAGVVYSFAIDIRNPESNQKPPLIEIESQGLVVIDAIAMHKSDTPLLGINDGSAPLRVVAPRFVFSNLEQSTLLPRVANTLTLSFELNVELAGADASIITLRGLSGAFVNGTSLELSDVDGGGMAAGMFCSANWTNATFELALCSNNTLRVDTVYKLTFEVENPPDNQPSPDVFISATGTARIRPTLIGKPGTAMFGDPNGRDPLRVVVPDFLQKLMSQSNLLAKVANVLQVVLESSLDLPSEDSAVIRIIGLEPAEQIFAGYTSSSIPLLQVDGLEPPLIFCDNDGINSRASWDASQKTLRINVCPGTALNPVTMLASKVYGFGFQITNPTQAQPSPEITIWAQRDAFDIPLAQVDYSTAELQSITGGASPLLILLPLKKNLISQSTPVGSEQNELTVQLTFNLNLTMSNTYAIKISGLENAIVEDPVQVWTPEGGNEASKLFCLNPNGTEAQKQQEYGRWDDSDFSITLSLCRDAQIAAGKPYIFSFGILNPSVNQESPAVTIRSFGVGGFPSIQMDKPNLPAKAVPNGANALFIVYWFILKEISQQTPLSDAPNTITVSLTTNVEIGQNSILTISGLSGGIMAIPPITSYYNNETEAKDLFCDANGLSAGTWNGAFSRMEFSFCPGKKMQRGTIYVFSFDVTNPASAQQSPPVSIEVSGQITVPISAMEKDRRPNLGVISGSSPLQIVVPEFVVRKIGQITPLASGTNTIIITISPNFDLAEATIRVSGLSGALVCEVPISIVTTRQSNRTDSLFCVDHQQSLAEWNRVSEELTLRACGSRGIGGLGTVLTAREEYEIIFNIRNPSESQDSPSISIEAWGPGITRLKKTAMFKPDQRPNLGVPSGLQPLHVRVVEFAVSEFQQETVTTNLSGCGDGWQEPSEECDDGNVASGDGCSETCRCESDPCIFTTGPDVNLASVVSGARPGTTILMQAGMYDDPTRHCYLIVVSSNVTVRGLMESS
eukprot:622616-Rhodomonas_salina.1